MIEAADSVRVEGQVLKVVMDRHFYLVDNWTEYARRLAFARGVDFVHGGPYGKAHFSVILSEAAETWTKENVDRFEEDLVRVLRYANGMPDLSLETILVLAEAERVAGEELTPATRAEVLKELETMRRTEPASWDVDRLKRLMDAVESTTRLGGLLMKLIGVAE